MNKERYSIRLATSKDIDIVKRIMITAHETIEDETWYFIETDANDDWLGRHISKDGFILVTEDLFDSNKVIAFLLVRYPRKNDDNLGLGIYKDERDILGVAHMDSTAVLPNYRGNHIMCLMVDEAERILPKSFTHLMATVHPENYASLGSLYKCGYKVLKEQENKYGDNMPRCILVKER